jgi:hypothetical protein
LDQRISTLEQLVEHGQRWATNGASVADGFVKAYSFAEMFEGASVDLRALAKSTERIIRSSTSPSEAMLRAIEECDQYFLDRQLDSLPNESTIKNDFLIKTFDALSRQIGSRQPLDLRTEEMQTESKASNAILGTLKAAPSTMVLAMLKRSAPLVNKNNGDALPVSEGDIGNRASQLCTRFGLRSIAIEGDSVLSSYERMKKLDCLENDLKTTAAMLGIVEKSLGTGKLNMKIGSREASMLKGQPEGLLEVDVIPGGNYQISIRYDQVHNRQRNLNHEFTHFMDLQLGLKALNGERSELMYFSRLPPSMQERLPEAKTSLENIFKLLEGDKELLKFASKTLDSANKNLVLNVIGREKYFSVSTSELQEITKIVTDKNSFFIHAAKELQVGNDWRERTLSLLSHESRESSVRSGSGDLDMIDRIAHISGLSVEEVMVNYVKAIDALTPEIHSLVPFFSQMSRYVNAPGAMVAQSALLNANGQVGNEQRYWTDPTEVLARMVGRGKGSWEAAKDAVFHPYQGQAYDESNLNTLNRCVTELAKTAGFETTEVGANLGSKYESQMEQVIKVASAAKDACSGALDDAMRVASSIGTRVVSLLADSEKKSASSCYRPR